MVKEDDREVISYMLFLIFSNVQQILAFIAVAFIFNAFPQTIAFAVFFAVLKNQAGGAHSNKHWVCFVVTTSLAFIVCLLSTMFTFPTFVPIIASMIMLLIVVLKAPIIHPNNPKTPRRQKIMRRNSIFIAISQCFLIAIFTLFLPILALPSALGSLTSASTLLFPVPENES